MTKIHLSRCDKIAFLAPLTSKAQFTLSPRLFASVPSRAYSSFSIFAISAWLLAAGSVPCSSNCFFTSGCATTLAMVAASLSMIGCGVPLEPFDYPDNDPGLQTHPASPDQRGEKGIDPRILPDQIL